MDYSESQKKFYISQGPETFRFDKALPKLPVPPLRETLQKYLKSIQPFVSKDEYQATAESCRDFVQSGEGDHLQTLLQQRSELCDNWLDDWWLQRGYLQFREPLMPFLNIAGPFAANNPGGAWPVDDGQEKPIEKVSKFVFHLMQFWKALRQERFKADVAKSGTHFTMHQFRNLFNTTRIPCLAEDKLHHFWKTQNEGVSPMHAIVLRNGHAFVFNPIEEKNEQLKSPYSIGQTLEKIRRVADEMKPGPGIGALTCDYRDNWTKNRQKLIALGNDKNLEMIETALFVIVMDQSRPSTDSETCWHLMCGDPSNRWADKSLSVIVFENGRGGVNSDHTPMDAMVNVAMSHFIDLGVTDNAHIPFAPIDNETNDQSFQVIKWKLDGAILNRIVEAKATALEVGKQLVIKRKPFNAFGKSGITKIKVNPDTFVQMAIQLAYIRLHGKPAPTYETATTRKFLKGRTETLRSCTPELVDFCEKMDSPSVEEYKKRDALMTAIKEHELLMREAKEGHGCDRHLFGLKCIAEENGLPIPKLFTDGSFVASGGNGNFVLSTSTCGYTGMSGGTSPMCLNGYGCFYNFEKEKIWLWIVAFRQSYETSIEKYTQALETALLDLHSLIQKKEESKL